MRLLSILRNIPGSSCADEPPPVSTQDIFVCVLSRFVPFPHVAYVRSEKTGQTRSSPIHERCSESLSYPACFVEEPSTSTHNPSNSQQQHVECCMTSPLVGFSSVRPRGFLLFMVVYIARLFAPIYSTRLFPTLPRVRLAVPVQHNTPALVHCERHCDVTMVRSTVVTTLSAFANVPLRPLYTHHE